MPENQKPARPATPSLDKARQEAEALAKFEQEEQEYQRREREERPAREKAAAERLAHHKQCKAACQQAATEADALALQLVAALDRYAAASEYAPIHVYPRIQNFLALHVRKYGTLDGRSHWQKDELMTELFPKEI